MPSNNIQHLSPDELVALMNQMAAGIGGGTSNPYGVSPSAVSALTTNASALATASSAVVAAKAAYHAAVQAREAKERTAMDGAAAVARTVYANAAVTPTMIAALGLSPRATSRTRIVPATPIEVTATAQPNGDVVLRWSRMGNRQGVNYIVEAQSGTGDWAFVGDTSGIRIVLAGFATGGAVSFRVCASKNGLVSSPSVPTSLYPAPAPAPSLRLAA